MHIVRHLGAGADGQFISFAIIFRIRGMRFSLHLANLCAVVLGFVNKIGFGEALVRITDLKLNMAFDIALAMVVEIDRVL